VQVVVKQRAPAAAEESSSMPMACAPSGAAVKVADRRLGLSVAKAVGHAPARARLRRLLRAAFRALRSSWPAGTDVVVMVRVPWTDATLLSVIDELRAAVSAALSPAQGARRPRPSDSVAS
jgi:ribonuclease P protein component